MVKVILMSKIKRLILILSLFILLTSCAKFNGQITVYEDESITFTGELLIQEDILNAQNMVASDLISRVSDDLSSNLEVQEITKEIDGVSYQGITITSKEPFDTSLIDISVNDGKMTLIIDQNIFTALGIELDSFNDSSDSINILKDLGLSMNLTINMPGSIISSNYGEKGMNSVNIDLLRNLDAPFIVVSYANNMFLYILIGVSVMLAIAIVILIILRQRIRNRYKKARTNNKIR